MNVRLIINITSCITCSILTYICVINLCNYFHVDEKDVVKRLIAVKNHEFKGNISLNNDFAYTKSNFRFRTLSKFLKNIKIIDKIRELLERADIPWQVDTFLIVSITLGIIPLIFALASNLLIIVLCPVGLFIPYFYAKYKIKKITTMFTRQLPDALDLLCNALRAGHSLFSAFEVIVDEMPNPVSKIFKVLTDEIALGIDVREAIKSVQRLVPESVDLRFFSTVVILQREIGGNLIKLLEILAATIRERFKMIGQLKAQTMQARLSGVIVSVIPPVICIVLFLMAPEYMDYLINSIWGKMALGISIVLMIVGYIVINRITDIEI